MQIGDYFCNWNQSFKNKQWKGVPLERSACVAQLLRPNLTLQALKWRQEGSRVDIKYVAGNIILLPVLQHYCSPTATSISILGRLFGDNNSPLFF